MRYKMSLFALLFYLIAAAILLPDACSAAYPEIMWWYDLDAPSFGSAAVGDIDGDGYPEIVFGTYFGDEHIYALNAEDGTLHWKFDTGGCNDASPAIADVDFDGDLEVIVPASSPSMVYCLSGDSGHVEWSRSTGYGNCIDSPPAVADVDDDDSLEVVLGTFNGHVYCLNGQDGSIGWHINLGTSSYIQSGPAVLDLDGDNDLDIVVAQYAGDCRVYALRGHDGSEIWHSDMPGDYMYHGASFADLDDNGVNEIIIGCYDGNVYAFDGSDGGIFWVHPAPYYVGAPTSCADFDLDGIPEVVAASYDRIRLLEPATGELVWNYTAGGSVFRGVSVADVDGDGYLDMAFGARDGILTVLRGIDKYVVWSYDLDAHYGRTYEIDHAPVIADFDLDGKLDIFVVGGYGISSPDTSNHGRAYALRAGDGPGPGWPMFRHDLVHSGRFETVTSGAPAPQGEGTSLAGIHPNPFRATTRIDFELTAAASIRLAVYDIRGRFVTTLDSGMKASGAHAVSWTGRDEAGHPVSPGIYFCRLESADSALTQKMLLLR